MGDHVLVRCCLAQASTLRILSIFFWDVHLSLDSSSISLSFLSPTHPLTDTHPNPM